MGTFERKYMIFFSSNFSCTSSCFAMAYLMLSNSSSLSLTIAAMVGDAAPASSAATRLLIAFSHSLLHDFNPSRIAVSFCLYCHAQRSAAIDWMFSLCSATSRVVSITSRSKKSFLTGLLGQVLLLSRLFLW